MISGERIEMKKALAIVILLSTGCAAETAPWATNTPDPGRSAQQAIAQFYRDWNYAVSFSTPAERSRLRFVTDLEQAEGLSHRLKSVGARLNNVEAKIQKIDVGMSRGSKFRVGAERLAPSSYSVTAELADLVDMEQNGSAKVVRVKFWPLLPPDNALLVSSYEKWQERTPTSDVLQLRSLSRFGPRTEIHTWTLVGGRWMRNEANLVLLQNQAAFQPPEI